MISLSGAFWGRVKKIDQAGFGTTAAFLANRVCSDRSFSIDRDGDRVNRQVDLVVVSPDMMPSRRKYLEEHVADNWLWDYQPAPDDVVLDIGAGIGEEAVILAPRVGRMICIEANDRVFRCLEKNIAENKLDNVTAIRCAISDFDGELRLSDDADHLANRAVSSGGIVVPAMTIESLCKAQGIDRVDFLKMNIEGAERQAVDGFGSIDVRRLVVSCHDFIGDPGLKTYDEVRAKLEAMGYEIKRRGDHPLGYTRFNIYAVRRPS